MARGAKAGKASLEHPSEEQILEEIRQRAYELYESRGQACSEGDDMRDWLTAEAEVRRKHADEL